MQDPFTQGFGLHASGPSVGSVETVDGSILTSQSPPLKSLSHKQVRLIPLLRHFPLTHGEESQGFTLTSHTPPV